MGTMEYGTIGKILLSMDSCLLGVSEIQAFQSSSIDFLKSWKKEYKEYQNHVKKYNNASVLSKASTSHYDIADSGKEHTAGRRPMRAARGVALNNIRKQVTQPLGRKLRRPDSDELQDAYGFRSSSNISRKRTTVTHSETKEQEEINEKRVTNNEMFAIPEAPPRTKKGRKKIKSTEVELDSEEKTDEDEPLISKQTNPERRESAEVNALVRTTKDGKKIKSKEVEVGSEEKTDEDGPLISKQTNPEKRESAEVNGLVRTKKNGNKIKSKETELGWEEKSDEDGPHISKQTSPEKKKFAEANALVLSKSRQTRSSEIIGNEIIPSVSPIPYSPGEGIIINKSRTSEIENDKNVYNLVTNDVAEEGTELSKRGLKGSILANIIFDETLEKSNQISGILDETIRGTLVKDDGGNASVAFNEASNNHAKPSKLKKNKGKKKISSNASCCYVPLAECSILAADVLDNKTSTPQNRALAPGKRNNQLSDYLGSMMTKESQLNESVPASNATFEKKEVSVPGAPSLDTVENPVGIVSRENSILDIFDQTLDNSARTRNGKEIKAASSKISEECVSILVNSSSLAVKPRSRRSTPQNVNNGTFVLGKRHSPMADSFGSGIKTVVRAKKHKKDQFLEESEPVSSTSLGESVDDIQFKIPVPVLSTKLAEPYFDAAGNPLSDNNQGARTKVLKAPSCQDLPEIHGSDRPVRVRTKVHRLGVENQNKEEHEHVEMADSQRMTRTKTKALKTAEESDSLKIAQAITRKSKARRASQAIHHKSLLKILASDKKYKTPSSAAVNRLKRPMIISSASKETIYSVKKNRPDYQISKVITKQNVIEEKQEQVKLKLQQKELAALKRREDINKRREILRQRNEEKLQRAMKCRAKLEEEKQGQLEQIEKEKENKRELILQDRKQKKKDEISKKRMLTEKKLANNEERRRIEEEIRLAKIREMELEQQRQLQEKQRQLEYEEKRARERLEEKRKMIEAEKLMKQKMAQAKLEAKKTEKAKPYVGKYLPRSENDLGLEDENSDNSDDEEERPSERALPNWVSEAKKKNPVMQYLNRNALEIFSLFMPLRSKTPNVQRMFNMSPKRTIKRTSSAIWNTSTMTPS